jgi:hypothetical protein
MSKQSMQDESNVKVTETTRYHSANLRACGASFRGGAASRSVKRSFSVPSRAPPLLNFLVHPSVVLVNLIPDSETGLVSIPYSAFKEGTFLEIFALDGHQSSLRTFVVHRSVGDLEFQKRDLRFKSPLDHTKHYIGERTGIDLDPKVQATAQCVSLTLLARYST